MTARVAELVDRRVFDPSPLLEDLAAYHCPFDELVAGAHVERRLAQVVHAQGRAPLVGVSGSGKTSVTAYVLGPLAEGVAPIRVPTRDLERAQVANPRVFVRHVLERVARVAGAAEQLSRAQRRALAEALATRRVVHGGRQRARLGVPRWLLAGGDLAVELERDAADVEVVASVDDLRALLERVLARISAEGLRPVLVIDDTDSWLNVADATERAALVGDFFAHVLRPLTEFDCGIVVATHRSYLDLPAVREAAAFVPDRVDVPALRDPSALAAILGRRLEANGIDAALTDVLEPGALERLWDGYVHQARGSIRRVLDVAHKALADAHDLGVERVTAANVASAAHMVFGPA